VTQRKKRILIIGLDGATFDLIKPWIAEGYLPNIERLVIEGSHGQLLSTIQPVTAPAWTTFLTGVNQGKHGLYDFIRRQSDSYKIEVTNASHNVAPTIFDIAGQYDQRVFSINVPYTLPTHPINGVMVGGPFVPAVTPQLVYPSSFYETLQKITPDYFVTPDYDSQNPDPLAAYARKLLLGIAVRERLSTYLLENEDWDLFMVVFMALDEAHHAFWHCLEAPKDSEFSSYQHIIRDVYQRVDQAIGTILSTISVYEHQKETVVFIVSDHGAGRLHRMVNLNRWLAEETGLLQFHQSSSLSPGKIKTDGVRWLAHNYRRYVSPKIRENLRRRLGTHRFESIKGNVESALYSTPINWEKTKAYALGAGGNIFINLKGREPKGTVEPGAEYDDLRQKIIESLLDLRDIETMSSIVERVYRREEIYHGPLIELAPDLIIQWKDYRYWGRGRFDSRAPIFDNQQFLDLSDVPLSGTHRPEGILIAHGQGVRPGSEVKGARLLDLAPTILSLLSIGPLREMDGKVLKDIFAPEYIETLMTKANGESDRPSDHEFEFSQEESEVISEHLRSLGYM
jgi:predicted AlkP superfamily phosphohydrolase/phosphomutase